MMEYSDGSDSVEPGESISVGHDDLGSATYDSDHDGVADSVIVGEGDHTLMVTDHDGDGQADEITTYDSHGHEIGSKAIGDGSNPSDSNSPSGPDTSGSDSSASTGTDTSASSRTDSSAAGSESGTGSGAGASSGADAAGETITMVDDHGNTVEVGHATVDMDNNGKPDTAVVHGADGSTTGFTDRNGDGEADQITRITADRQVTIMVSDGNGSWSTAATGHLDDNGKLVEDSSGGVSAASDGGSSNFANATEDNADSSDELTGLPDISYTDAGGQSYQLGAPTADFDNDGTPDTVITTLDDGTVVGYSDTDGDGQTDQVTQIDPDGTVTIGVPDGDGGWEQAATGTLGPDGEFVPSVAAVG